MKDKPKFFSSLSAGVIFSVNNELSLRVTHLSADESLFLSSKTNRIGDTLSEQRNKNGSYVPRAQAEFLTLSESRSV